MYQIFVVSLEPVTLMTTNSVKSTLQTARHLEFRVQSETYKRTVPSESKKYTRLKSHNTTSIASILKLRLGPDR